MFFLQSYSSTMCFYLLLSPIHYKLFEHTLEMLNDSTLNVKTKFHNAESLRRGKPKGKNLIYCRIEDWIEIFHHFFQNEKHKIYSRLKLF